MREIKFRAWHKPEKYMYQNIKISEDNEYIEDGTFELMQFTGLKDWYEGDILKTHEGNFEIQFIDGRFCVLLPDLGYQDIYLFEEIAEIIGNIYENPELLEGNK